MSLINSRLLAFYESNPNLYKWVERPSEYGAFDCFMKDNEAMDSIISEDVRNRALMAIGTDLKSPVFDEQTVTISNSRSVTISDNELTSQMVTFTFATLSTGFTQTPSAFINNKITPQENFNQQMKAVIRAFGAALDTLCLSELDTNKTQVFGLDPVALGYTVVGDLVTAPLSKREEIVGDLQPLMVSNDFGGKYRLLGNPGFLSQIRKMDEKGLYNEVNKQIQYAGTELHFSNRLANAAGYFATGYAIKEGSTGIMFQHEPEAVIETELPDGTKWSRDTLPMLNIPIDTYFYHSKGDFSALWGAATAELTRAAKHHFGFAINVCVKTSYNQDLTTKANPIIGFQIATS